MRAVSLCLIASLCFGCSALGWADFEIPKCTTHADCNGLNEAYGITDPCLRYMCAQDGYCTLQAVDLDRDGHASIACAGSSGCSQLACDDCDDGAPQAFGGNAEVCDGFDNDCNSIVDDVGGGATALAPTTLVSVADSVDWHDYGNALPGSHVAPIAFRAGTTFFNAAERDPTDAQPITFAYADLTDARTPAITNNSCPRENPYTVSEPPLGTGITAGTCQTNADCYDTDFCNGYEVCSPAHPMADAMGCIQDADYDRTNPGTPCSRTDLCLPDQQMCAEFLMTACSFADLATAELSPGTWFGAAIQQTQCGVVRIGYFTETQGDGMSDPGRNLLLRGDYTRSNSYAGIDVDYTGDADCAGESTGASRPDGDALGARLPSIAALPGTTSLGRLRPEALAVWLAESARNGDGMPAPVEVIGAWQEQTTEGGSTQVAWVSATGNGIPQRLDATAVGDVRPVVLPWTGASTEGYVVAYGVDGGGIALRFVPAFPDDNDVTATGQTNIPAGGHTQRETDAIADLGTEAMLATSGDALHVVAAFGRAGGDDVTVALAWIDDGGVELAMVPFSSAGGGFDTTATPVNVAALPADDVSIAHSEEGLVLAGFRAPGGQVADASTLGGWLVAWANGGTALGARFRELDGGRMDPQTMQLGTGLSRMSVYIGGYTDAGGTTRDAPRVAYYNPTAMEFRSLGAFCGPPL